MGSYPDSRRFGRRAALIAALGAAVVATLAAPGGLRLYQEAHAIHELDSADQTEVLDGIATLVRLKSERGAKRIFELAARLDDEDDHSVAAEERLAGMWGAMTGALNKLPLTDGFFIERAQSGAPVEQRLALMEIGWKRIEAGIPLLRRVAAEGGPLSQEAILSLAKLLRVVKLLGTERTGAGIEARFRLQNDTGYDLWYVGPASRPAYFKVVNGKGQKPYPRPGRERHLLGQGEWVDFSETFAWNELPGSLSIILVATSGTSEGFGTVRSETVEVNAAGGPRS